MFTPKLPVLFAVLLIVVLAAPAAVALAAAGSVEISAPTPFDSPLTWAPVHQAPAGQYFYGITFPTKDVGYAVSGPDWNNAANGKGAPTYISKTSDGGKTWRSTAIAGTDGWSRGITCTDANNCWIAGMVSFRIRRTTDGGATWKNMTNQSGYSAWLWSVGNTGQGTTILAGTTCYDPKDAGAVANWLRSTDGQIFTGVIGQPGVYNCFVQWDIECPAPGYCYSVGKDVIWRSTNNGANWTRLLAGVGRYYGGSCTSTTNCWISGKTPFIKSTTNSGAAWIANTVNGAGANTHLWDIVMLDNTHGYAAGCSNTELGTDRCLGSGVIYRTEDGKTWNQITSPTTADIMDIWAFNTEDVYLVDWSGKIWHGVSPAPATPNVMPSGSGSGVVLSWPVADATNYEVWRSLSLYFVPGDPSAEQLQERAGMTCVDTLSPRTRTCTIPTAAGGPANYAYIVRAVGAGGLHSDSNRTATFTYEIKTR